MGGSSRSKTRPVFYEVWFPGQKEYMGEFLDPFKQIFSGNYATPQAKMLQQIVGEQAMAQTAQSRRMISGTRGMTAPAKAKAVSQLGSEAVTAMAGVPKTIWQVATDVLRQYALAPPQVVSGQHGSERGWNVGCWVWTHFDGEHGEITEKVRSFRNISFGKFSPVAIGYRKMGKVMLPLMRLPFVEFLIYYSLYKPISMIAQGNRNCLIMMVGHFWKFTFEKLGRADYDLMYHPSF